MKLRHRAVCCRSLHFIGGLKIPFIYNSSTPINYFTFIKGENVHINGLNTPINTFLMVNTLNGILGVNTPINTLTLNGEILVVNTPINTLMNIPLLMVNTQYVGEYPNKYPHIFTNKDFPSNNLKKTPTNFPQPWNFNYTGRYSI